MVEVDIGRAVEKTESETSKLRLEGLEDLRRLFVQSKGTQKLDSLGDEGYHRIFEGVFRIVRIEKPAYVRATKSARNAVTSRLEACAVVLRLAVETGISRIRSRTAIAVIDHIIETLPLEAEGLCIPLRNDYLKSLRAILEYAPIGEHLRQRHWEALCDFLVTGLNTNSSEDSFRSTTSLRQTTSQESRNGYQVPLRVSQVSGSRGQASDTASFAEELIVSLKLLTAITNSPLMTRANAIFGSMIAYLATATKAQSDAISAFNNALARTITEDISLSRRALFDFLPSIRRLWSIKSALVKDQILITLILGNETLASSDAITTTSNDFSSLDNVFEAILAEYRRRLERDMLHLEYCRFSMHDNVVGVSLTGLVPAYENPRALSCWTVVWALSFLARVLDDHQARESGRAIVSGTAAKKLRLSLRSEGTIDQAMTTTGSERLCAVQMLVMLLEKSTDVQNKCAEELPRLASKLMEDDSVIVSWVMLSISR
jgi:serine-protein kinase ATM